MSKPSPKALETERAEVRAAGGKIREVVRETFGHRLIKVRSFAHYRGRTTQKVKATWYVDGPTGLRHGFKSKQDADSAFAKAIRPALRQHRKHKQRESTKRVGEVLIRKKTGS